MGVMFIMMVGLPGSGKSTYAKELAREYNAIICSSDSIREELYGDENFQNQNEKVFQILHKRIKQYLKDGVSVIYDATNINSKRRRAFLNEIKKFHSTKMCVIMATRFDRCCDRNEHRLKRIVPYDVITRMYKNWNTPYWYEGWDIIKLKYEDDIPIYDNPHNLIFNYRNYNQDNPHHKETLGQHLKLVANEFEEDTTLYYAGLLHDCGKIFTKSFINSKGEKTDIAHYYQHHCVGAYNSLFYIFKGDVESLDVSILVNLHMMPYNWEKGFENSEKIKRKYQKLWGDKLYNDVMLLHAADLKAH